MAGGIRKKVGAVLPPFSAAERGTARAIPPTQQARSRMCREGVTGPGRAGRVGPLASGSLVPMAQKGTTMSALTVRTYRPALEILEDRYTPAGTVTGSFAQGTLTLIGDAAANRIVLESTAVANRFKVSGSDGTTVAGVTAHGNVRNIVVSLGDGEDAVSVAPSAADARVSLAGNLKVHGGDAANEVDLDRVFVNGNLRITNGTSTTGQDYTEILDSTIRGAVTVRNGDGDTGFSMWRTTPGPSSIGGNLTITNGTGKDGVEISDTSIGGSVVVHNGQGDASGEAGYLWIYNTERQSRSVINGSVSVTYLSGDVDYDGIWDTEVKGNVTFNHGPGAARTDFDGYTVSAPVIIRGHLTLTGSGPLDLDVGTREEKTGLWVGKNLTITGGSQADLITAHRLTVNGTTRINTGDGDDVITIDDSVFRGPDPRVAPVAVEILTGAGNDSVAIETDDTFTGVTLFTRRVKVDLGEADDTFTLGFADEAGRQVQVQKRAVWLGNTGVGDVLNH